MAAEFPLSLVIKAVDKATAPLRQINERMKAFTAPVRKLNNSFKALSDEAGVPRLSKAFGHVGHAVGHVFHAVEGLITRLLTMEVIGGFAFYEIVKKTMEAGTELGKMAGRIGLGVDQLARLRFAAEQAGVSQEEFTSALDQFNKRLGEAKADGGPLLEFLYKVSPVLAVQVKNAKSTSAAFELMQRAFEKVTDPAKRAALQAAAFGRSSREMGHFLGQGRAETEKWAKRYDELAGSQEELAHGSHELHQALNEASAAFEGLRNAALVPLMPALSEIARAVADVVAGNREGLAAWARETGAAISAWVAGGGIERLIASMREWADVIVTVFNAIGGLKGVLVILGTYLAAGFVVAVAGAVKALIALGVALLATPVGWVIAGIAALAGVGLLVYKYWEPIKSFFAEIWGYVSKILGSPLESVGRALRWMFPAATWDTRPPEAAAADRRGLPDRRSEAKVTVDFNNAPKGARATVQPGSTADLDLSMGYSLVAP
jgi:phage-related minor tail protein